MTNAHIHKFAMDYCFSKTPPKYALLIKGAWGSGKTWFTNNLINDIKKKNGGTLYVSLYGLNSLSAIEGELYKKLHPILSNRGVEIAGKILRGALKTTLKIDLNGDKLDDGSISLSIPQLNLSDYLKNTSGLVLIFDDLERCSINLPDLLGYINHFVEHQEQKVIIVANETELKKDQDYNKTKEKLIGKTFEISPRTDDALTHFITETGAEQFYELRRELIKNIHSQSDYKNLRHLRQALLDFARFKNNLPSEVTNSAELMTHLLRTFLIFTIEVRHGAMTTDDIRSLRELWINHRVSRSLNNNDPEQEQPLAVKLTNKYLDFEIHDLLIEQSMWCEAISDQMIDFNPLILQLKNSRYLISKTSPDWVRLWDFRSHTNDDFTNLANKVWRDFENNEYTAQHEIKHIFGMMLFFSIHGLFAKSADEILTTSKQVIQHLRNNDLLANRRKVGFREDDSAMGLGYMLRDHQEFVSFCNYFRQQEQEAYRDTLPARGVKLLQTLRESPTEFSHRLSEFTEEDNYQDTPILSSIKPEDFINALITLPAQDLYDACKFFKRRYINETHSETRLERDWVFSVKSALEQEISVRQGTLYGHCLKEVLNGSISEAIAHLTPSGDWIAAQEKPL